MVLCNTNPDRRYFELCLFTQVVNELKSGDLCLPGSDDYGDYRDQLVSWEHYHRDVGAYATQAGVSADPATFVAELKAKLAEVAGEVDRAFPDNAFVEIVGGRPVIGRLRAKPAPEGADRRIPPVRDVFPVRSLCYADPRKGLLTGAAWEAALPSVWS